MEIRELYDAILATIEKYTDLKPDTLYYESGLTNLFTIKGRDKWWFAVWIYGSEDDSTLGENEFEVQCFGQYVNFIDKFKPSCSPIHYKFRFNVEDDSDSGHDIYWRLSDTKLFDFMETMRAVAISDYGALIKYYWRNNEGDEGCDSENPVLWLLYVWLRYVVLFSIQVFWTNDLAHLLFRIRKGIYGFLFRRQLKSIELIDYGRHLYALPSGTPRYYFNVMLKDGVGGRLRHRIVHLLNPICHYKKCRTTIWNGDGTTIRTFDDPILRFLGRNMSAYCYSSNISVRILRFILHVCVLPFCKIAYVFEPYVFNKECDKDKKE